MRDKIMIISGLLLYLLIFYSVASNYGVTGFVIMSIITIGLPLVYFIKQYQEEKKEYQKDQKQLKEIRSIIYKLNTQWKE